MLVNVGGHQRVEKLRFEREADEEARTWTASTGRLFSKRRNFLLTNDFYATEISFPGQRLACLFLYLEIIEEER